MNDELASVSIYSALNKPNLIAGCDRELILMTGVIVGALVFTGMTFITTIIGIILFVFISFFLRMMAKADPLMRAIFVKQLSYKKFYYARSTPFTKD